MALRTIPPRSSGHEAADSILRSSLGLSDIAQENRISGAAVFIPPGVYRLNEWTITRPITVVGCGRATRLVPTADCTTYVIRIIRHPDVAQGLWNSQNRFSGAVLQNFMIDGDARSIACGGIQMYWADHCTLRDLWIEEIQYEAIDLQASVRESSFAHIHTRFCGSPGRPTLDIYDDGSTDGHNNLFFTDMFLVYSMGDTVRIGTVASNTTRTRSIFFKGGLIHGFDDFTYYTPASGLRHFLIEWSESVFLQGLRLNAWGGFQPNGATPAILLSSADGNPSGTKRATSIVLSGCSIGKPSDSVTSPGVSVNSAAVVYNIANFFEALASPNFIKPAGVGSVLTPNYVAS